MDSYLNDDYKDLMQIARDNKKSYLEAAPYPHISFKNFFNPDKLREILSEFPDLGKGKNNIKFNSPNEVKLASKGEHRFQEKTKAIMHYLNSQPFLEFLKELTSIEEILLPDPYFEGGGFHQIKPGGFLKVHADFNKHKMTKLDRRLNVLVYLNEDWEESYGGHFELWDKEMTKCVKKVLPEFNTLTLFTTTDFTYHGLPDPLTCPPDRSRKSMALYYYTNGRPAEEVNQGLEDHNTLFKARKDGTDEAMRSFNTKQRVKNLIQDITPPILVRYAKKLNGSGAEAEV